MPVLVSPGMLDQVRRVHAGSLGHVYTRWPTVPAALPPDDENSWGEPLLESSTPDPPRACLFGYIDVAETDSRGPVIRRRPLLRIAHDDPLAVGDLVTDVTDQDGLVLLALAAVARVQHAPNRGRCVTATAELRVTEASLPPPPGGA